MKIEESRKPKSQIDWCGRTWELTEGCTRVDPCCINCYAEYLVATRLKHKSPGLAEFKDGGARWTGEVHARPDRLGEWRRWGRRAELVFVCSRSDLFHDKIDRAFRFRVWAEFAAALALGHTFIVLTKRAEAVAADLEWIYAELRATGIWSMPWPLPNVWVGTTIGTKAGFSRWEALKNVPAAVRWVSAEPLLEDIAPAFWASKVTPDWIVAGGETARPMHEARKTNPDYFRNLQGYCRIRAVPFYFKQWGNVGPDGTLASKAENGHLLDGTAYREYPVSISSPVNWNHYFAERYAVKNRLAQITE